MEDFFDLENYVNVVRSKIKTMLDKLEEAKNLNQQLDQVSLFRNDDYAYMPWSCFLPDSRPYRINYSKWSNVIKNFTYFNEWNV